MIKDTPKVSFNLQDLLDRGKVKKAYFFLFKVEGKSEISKVKEPFVIIFRRK